MNKPYMYNKERNAIIRVLHAFFGLSSFLPKFGELVPTTRLLTELKECNALLCGGAVTSIFSEAKRVNDLDFYVRTVEDEAAFRKMMRNNHFSESFVSSNAITYERQGERRKYRVQLITRFKGEPQDIFDKFDFTITHGAFDFSTLEFTLGDRFLVDLAKKKLVYAGSSEFPICALYRTKKYMKRGFTCPGSTLMHIGLSIVALDIQTYGELKEQLLGIDTLVLGPLLEGTEPSMPVNIAEFVTNSFKRFDDGTAFEEDEDE